MAEAPEMLPCCVASITGLMPTRYTHPRLPARPYGRSIAARDLPCDCRINRDDTIHVNSSREVWHAAPSPAHGSVLGSGHIEIWSCREGSPGPRGSWGGGRIDSSTRTNDELCHVHPAMARRDAGAEGNHHPPRGDRQVDVAP